MHFKILLLWFANLRLASSAPTVQFSFRETKTSEFSKFRWIDWFANDLHEIHKDCSHSGCPYIQLLLNDKLEKSSSVNPNSSSVDVYFSRNPKCVPFGRCAEGSIQVRSKTGELRIELAIALTESTDSIVCHSEVQILSGQADVERSSCPIFQSINHNLWNGDWATNRSATALQECVLHRLGGQGPYLYGAWHVCVTDALLRSREALRAEDRAVVYSFGVGLDTSFDEDIADAYQVAVHTFDPTPKSIDFVRSLPPGRLPPCLIAFHPFGLAGQDGPQRIFPPQNPDHVSHTALPSWAGAQAVTVPMLSLPTIMHLLGHSRVHVLKLNIEGGEYEVLESLLGLPPLPPDVVAGRARPPPPPPPPAGDGGPAFDQLCVEFHPQNHPKGLLAGRVAAGRIIDALSAHGFQVVHDTATESPEMTLVRMAG